MVFFIYLRRDENTVLKSQNSKKSLRLIKTNENITRNQRTQSWSNKTGSKSEKYVEVFGISKVHWERRKQNTDRQNILHFLPTLYSSGNQQLLRSKPMFKSTLIDTSQSVYAGMNVKFRNLSLWFRDFLNIDPRHWLPASEGIVTISTIWLTITDPESNAHLAFVDVVTVTLNMADTGRIKRLHTTQVHNTVNW